MTRIIGKLLCLFVVAPLLAGCAFVAGGKTVGFTSGRFISMDGSVEKIYPFPIDKVRKATEEALRELKAEEIAKSGGISRSTLKGRVQGDDIRVDIAYVTADRTSVSILVGVAGSYTGSQLIHEKIAEILRRS